jgi:hypothetical protein
MASHMKEINDRVGLTADEAGAVRAQLTRILESESFRSSRRCCRFLEYLVLNLIEGGPPENVKERVIGTEVYHRAPAYDTAQDNIVRVTATEVRKRLALYYADPGATGNPVIHLSPGSYAVTLHWRSASTESIAPSAAIAPAQLPISQTPIATKTRRNLSLDPVRTVIIIIAVAAGSILLVALLFQRSGRTRSDVLQQVWAPLLNDQNPVLVCISQPGDAFAQSSAVDFVPVPDSYVGVGDAYALAEIARFLSTRGKPWRLLTVHETPSQDLKSGPLVLIGSYSNPWTLKLTQNLRFVFAPLLELAIRDKFHPGNEWKVANITPPGKASEDYAIVSRFLSPEAGEPVIVVAGVTNLGTQAAGEFIASPEMLAAALREAPRDWKHQNFQFVLHTNVIGNTPEHPTVVASYFW